MIRVYISQPNFSGQLGQNASTRRVEITGTATLQFYLEGEVSTDVRSGIKNEFLNNGWIVSNLQIVGRGDNFLSTSLRKISNSVSIVLVADVPNAYDNKQHKDFADRVFTNAFWAGKTLFTSVDLTLSADTDKPNYTAPSKPLTVKTPTPTPTPNNSNGGGAAGNPTYEEILAAIKGGAGSAAGSAFDWSKDLFGLGGLTIGTAAIILMAVVLIKR